jgi:hypothetical protein
VKLERIVTAYNEVQKESANLELEDSSEIAASAPIRLNPDLFQHLEAGVDTEPANVITFRRAGL